MPELGQAAYPVLAAVAVARRDGLGIGAVARALGVQEGTVLKLVNAYARGKDPTAIELHSRTIAAIERRVLNPRSEFWNRWQSGRLTPVAEILHRNRGKRASETWASLKNKREFDRRVERERKRYARERQRVPALPPSPFSPRRRR